MPEKIESHLDAVFAPNQKRLVSIQPELAFTFNLWRKALPRESSWYVSLDEYSLTAVLIEDGHWNRVHMTRTHSKWQVELKRLLGLSRLTAGLNGTLPVYIDSIKAIRDEGRVEFSDLHWLDSDSETRNRSVTAQIPALPSLRSALPPLARWHWR
jgi:hypothetical protein